MSWVNNLVGGAGRRSTRGQGTSQGTGDRAARGGKERKRHSGLSYSQFGTYRP